MNTWKFSFVLLLIPLVSYGTKGFKNFTGIAQVPKLFSGQSTDGPPGSKPIQSGEVKIYSQPDAKSSIVFSFKDGEKQDVSDHVKAVEFGYEEKGLEVFGEKDGWYRVEIFSQELIDKYKSRYAWISSSDVGKFHPYFELLKGTDRIIKGWLGYFYTKPDLDSKIKLDVSKISFPITVEVLEQKNNFFRVKVFDSHPCSAENEPKLIGTYWFPATNLKGRPNIWYYSRGC